MKYRIVVYDPKKDEFVLDVIFNSKKGALLKVNECVNRFDSSYIICLKKE